LKANGVSTDMSVFPDEGHGIPRPVHGEDAPRRILAWLEMYDKR
jgi:dipeptidyl aminopeptidase/acylaminoacyl peptidase